MVDRSLPQMPDSSGFTRAQPSWPAGGSGSFTLTSRRGASGPDSSPGTFVPTVRAADVARRAMRKSSSASAIRSSAAPPASGSAPCGIPLDIAHSSIGHRRRLAYR